MNRELVSRLLNELRQMPICDPHSHVRQDQPVAQCLGDLLGYHYYTELSNSSRGRPVELPEDPMARVEYVWPHLPQLRGTVQFDWMMGISEIFFEIPRGDWFNKPRKEVIERAQRVIEAPDYRDKVFERSRVSKVYLTNQFDEDLSGLTDKRLVPSLRTDDLVFNLSTQKTIKRLDKLARVKSGKRLAAFERAVRFVFDRFGTWKMGYAALGLPPNFECAKVKRKAAERILKRYANNSKVSAKDRETWAQYAIDLLASECRRVGAPFCLMTGADRNVYPQGVPAGQDQLRSDATLRGYDRLFNAFPEVRFPVLILTDSTGLELDAAGWIRHNVYPFSHWWYDNNPICIRRAVRRRLDVLPRNKFIGFHSDGYSLEFVLPKFNAFRLQLAEVLAERIEESQIAGSQVIEPLDFDGAMAVAEKILLQNPDEILGLK
jgi:glucuronate isomerase